MLEKIDRIEGNRLLNTMPEYVCAYFSGRSLGILICDSVRSASAFSSALIRWMADVPTPWRAMILRRPGPTARSARMARSFSGEIMGRPSLLPLALARFRPANTRSRIMARSNSAKTPSSGTSPCPRKWSCRCPAGADRARPPLGVDLGQERHQVLQRTPEPVDRPRQDDIELAAYRALEHPVEGRPVLATRGARDAGVLEHLYAASASRSTAT
jgi:hypothetical protein